MLFIIALIVNMQMCKRLQHVNTRTQKNYK